MLLGWGCSSMQSTCLVCVLSWLWSSAPQKQSNILFICAWQILLASNLKVFLCNVFYFLWLNLVSDLSLVGLVTRVQTDGGDLITFCLVQIQTSWCFLCLFPLLALDSNVIISKWSFSISIELYLKIVLPISLVAFVFLYTTFTCIFCFLHDSP